MYRHVLWGVSHILLIRYVVIAEVRLAVRHWIFQHLVVFAVRVLCVLVEARIGLFVVVELHSLHVGRDLNSCVFCNCKKCINYVQ